MFQTQEYFEGFTSTPTFVRERSMRRSMSLLQMTQHVRDGRHRLTTPDKTAVLDLSTSFKKRCLGKQQQILSDIAARCREQEIEDLSNQMTGKVILQEGAVEPEMATYATNYMTKREKTSDDLLESARRTARQEKQQDVQRNYKQFPARKIIKHPSKNELSKPSPSRVRIAYIRGVPRFVANSRTRLVETRRINGPIQLEHYIQPKLDPLAPLIRNPSSMDSEYQNRIDSYFCTARMSLGTRSRTMWESGSGVSGPSLRSARTLKPLQSRRSDMEAVSDSESPGPAISQLGKLPEHQDLEK